MNTLDVRYSAGIRCKATVLRNISLCCRTGEVLGIFGRNGAGKSTLMKAIFGSLNPCGFQVFVNGSAVAPSRIIEGRLVGYLPQHSFVPKDLTVRKVIEMYFHDGDRQNKMFYQERIASFERRSVGSLSGGERRFFETILLCNLDHQFLLLDEPFAGIEPIYVEYLIDYFLSLRTTKGLIISDHKFASVFSMTDRNYLLMDGHCLSVGSLDDLQLLGYIS